VRVDYLPHSVFEEFAHDDRPIADPCEQTISRPTLAKIRRHQERMSLGAHAYCDG